jgi:hypothetical protein
VNIIGSFIVNYYNNASEYNKSTPPFYVIEFINFGILLSLAVSIYKEVLNYIKIYKAESVGCHGI